MSSLSEFDSVVTIDTHYIEPGRAAAYLVAGEEQAVFIDNNTANALPWLLEALNARDLRLEQVAYTIITHIHLDHAAGTAALLEACPNATALVHPRGARHIVDPSRLETSARKVYGDDAFNALYGHLEPVPGERVRGVEDGERLDLGGRTLTILHTGGHARHHVCIHDSISNGVFTGDAFGVAHPPVQHGERPYLLCSAPPTEFDAEAARQTVHRLVATGADHAYLTHYGPIRPLGACAEELLRSIDDMESIRREAAASGLVGPALYEFCAERVRAAVERQMDRCGIRLGPDDWPWLRPDVHMNALGLAHTAKRPV